MFAFNIHIVVNCMKKVQHDEAYTESGDWSPGCSLCAVEKCCWKISKVY